MRTKFSVRGRIRIIIGVGWPRGRGHAHTSIPTFADRSNSKKPGARLFLIIEGMKLKWLDAE